MESQKQPSKLTENIGHRARERDKNILKCLGRLSPTVKTIIQKWKKDRHKDTTKELKKNNGIKPPEKLYKYSNIKKNQQRT